MHDVIAFEQIFVQLKSISLQIFRMKASSFRARALDIFHIFIKIFIQNRAREAAWDLTDLIAQITLQVYIRPIIELRNALRRKTIG